MISVDFEGWKREKLCDGGTVYRLARDGIQIAATWRKRWHGWIVSGPRVPHAAPFETLKAAQAFCEANA